MLTVPNLLQLDLAPAALGAGLLLRIASFAEGGAELFGTRPWELRISDDSVEVLLVPDSRLRKVDPDGRESVIAAGTALYLLRLAMRCHMLEPEIRLTPDFKQPRLLARLTIVDRTAPSPEEIALFTLLSTGKGEMTSIPLSSDVLAPEFRTLALAACDEGPSLRYIEHEYLMGMTHAMLQPGDRLDYQTEEDRDAFRDWLGAAPECNSITREFVSWEVTTKDLSGDRSPKVPDAHGVLCTTHDDAASWLATGQALARMHLLATCLGMTLTVFNQPLQVPGMRARFARETGFCSFPQVIVRLSSDPLTSQRLFSDLPGPCDCGCGGDCKGT